MYNAKPIVSEKFWILERNGERVGTIRKVDSDYEVKVDESCTIVTYQELLDKYNEDLFTYYKEAVRTTVTVFGYPTEHGEVFNVEQEDHIPTFTKSAKSTVRHCAGYYGIKFPKGWVTSFCPKFATLKSYEFIGPFKTESDMNIGIKRERDCESQQQLVSMRS